MLLLNLLCKHVISSSTRTIAGRVLWAVVSRPDPPVLYSTSKRWVSVPNGFNSKENHLAMSALEDGLTTSMICRVK